MHSFIDEHVPRLAEERRTSTSRPDGRAVVIIRVGIMPGLIDESVIPRTCSTALLDTSGGTGTGLGLSISQEIITGMGGVTDRPE